MFSFSPSPSRKWTHSDVQTFISSASSTPPDHDRDTPLVHSLHQSRTSSSAGLTEQNVGPEKVSPDNELECEDETTQCSDDANNAPRQSLTTQVTSVHPSICTEDIDESDPPSCIEEDSVLTEEESSHLLLPPSRSCSVSRTPSIDSLVEELQHVSIPPPFIMEPMPEECSSTPTLSPSSSPESLTPEWVPSREEVLQMRRNVAWTGPSSPHLWQNTVYHIRSKVEQNLYIGSNSISNGLLEVMAEAVYSNVNSLLQLLVDELLFDVKRKCVNELFVFHPLCYSGRRREHNLCPKQTLLHLAVCCNNPIMVRTILEDLGASPNIEDSNGHTPIHEAVMRACQISTQRPHSSDWAATMAIIASLLSDDRATPNKLTKDGLTPLAMALRHLFVREGRPKSSSSPCSNDRDALYSINGQFLVPIASPRKLVELLLSHGAQFNSSLHRMSFVRSTFTASLQSCTAEEFFNSLIPNAGKPHLKKSRRPPPHSSLYLIRDAKRCSRNAQSQIYALSGCQLVFQELRQHIHQQLKLRRANSRQISSAAVGSSYLLLPVVQIKDYWRMSLVERTTTEGESSVLPPCDSYGFRREVETLNDLEEVWQSYNLTDEIVYQSLMIMERCLGLDDLLMMEMIVLAHYWVVSALKADNGSLLFLHFLDSLSQHVKSIPRSSTSEGFLRLLELEQFIGTVIQDSEIGSLLLSPVDSQGPSDSIALEECQQEYIEFASNVLPALSSLVHQCSVHQTCGSLPLVDSLILSTYQNALSLIGSRVFSCGANGSLVKWMMQKLVSTSSKINYSNGDCTTILHTAIDISSGNTCLLAALLEMGAHSVINTPRQTDILFDLPIHTARTQDTVTLLIKHGAHWDAVNSEGKTLKDLCPSLSLNDGNVPPLFCLSCRAIVKRQIPYQELADIPTSIVSRIDLHNLVRSYH